MHSATKDAGQDQTLDSSVARELLSNDALLLKIQLVLIVAIALSISLLCVFFGRRFMPVQRILLFVCIIILDIALALNFKNKYLISLTITLCVTFMLPWFGYFSFIAEPRVSMLALMFTVVPIQLSSLFIAGDILLPLALVQILTTLIAVIQNPGLSWIDRCLIGVFSAVISAIAYLSNDCAGKQKKRIISSIQLCINSERRMWDDSVRDSLTGLFNRRYLEAVLDDLTKNTVQYFGILMIDIDHFKIINDTYGHVVGDCVLKQVADVLSTSHRTSDVAARYGGDEFILILLNCSIEDAVNKAEGIRRQIASLTAANCAEQPFNVAVSIGVAQYPLNGEDRVSILTTVDKMLYTAKQNGRNQVATAKAVMA